MNYTKEVNAFYDWLETNSIAVSSIAVWHALMHICNKTGWLPEFTVAVSVLSAKTGLERRTIYNARNELKLKGRIEFKERKGNQSAIYSILWFCDNECESIDTNNAHNLSHNTSHNLSHNTSHNLSPLKDLKDLELDLSRSTLLDRSTSGTKINQKKKDIVHSDPRPLSPVTKLIKQYQALFKAKCNNEEPVVNWGKDSKLIHDLLKERTEERVSQVMIDFFSSDDPFITEHGYNIGIFKSQFNQLLIARNRMEQELAKTYGEIDFKKYPGGPDCKCEGKGWFVVLKPDPTSGIERNSIEDCPCKLIHSPEKATK
jgi:hypothetical protein